MDSFLCLVQLDLSFYQLFIGSGFELKATQRVGQSSSILYTGLLASEASQDRECLGKLCDR
jgi:hypothetical protein